MEDLYGYLKGMDVIDVLSDMVKLGILVPDEEDEQKRLKPNTMRVVSSPWLFAGAKEWQNCYRDMDVLFEKIFKKLRIAPSTCHQCWKVVVKMDTLEQLMEMWGMQQTEGRPGKCGIELRSFVKSLYGAYWYNSSLEEGQECKRLVKESMSKIPVLANCEPILKRGCTEIEEAAGPSDKWAITPEQEHIEALIKKYTTIDEAKSYWNQPEYVVTHTLVQWIEWAAANGDETYKLFTGGKEINSPMKGKFHPPYVTY